MTALSSGFEMQDKLDLADLPEDVLILVLHGLDAWDVVNCQLVCQKWRHVFSEEEYLREMLKKYPRARETAPMLNYPRNIQTNIDWKTPFHQIARRYLNLNCGKVKSVVKLKLQPLEQKDRWHPVGQWDYHESQPGGRLYYEYAATHLSRLGNKPYLFRPTLWSYSDGLLACAMISDKEPVEDGEVETPLLSILDLRTMKAYTVPFNATNRVIRNIAFNSRSLIVEWAERDPFHDLNDSEKVHRHFATCFDLKPMGSDEWQVTFRNEWKLHFLGLPLNLRDRFFSTHDGKHYAVYFWQPNRSMYTGDEDMPIEALFVWDISIPSSYLPSLDPGGRNRPPENERPHPVAVFSFRDLDFLGVRQHSDITLMSIHLDSITRSLSIRENTCVAGQGYFDPAERLMCTTTTTFPFLGSGPAFQQQWQGDLPPYRGHCSMESSDIESSEKWFIPVMDVYDEVADVRFSLVETCFTGLSSENKLLVRIKSRDEWRALDDKLAVEIAEMGRIAGDERWLIGQNSKMEIVILTF